MHICSKCGAHYNSNFYACPQCGNAKYEAEDKQSPGSKIAGTLISLFVVLGLLGIIGYGYYTYKHPFDAGPTITDVDWEAQGISTTTTTTTIKSSTTSTTKTTTTKLVGETYEYEGHSLTLPQGFSGRTTDEFAYAGYAVTYMCAYNNSDSKESYCYGIQNGVNYSTKNKESANQVLNSQGYSSLTNAKYYNVSINYSYKNSDDGYTNVIVYYNKGPNLIIAYANIHASDINENTMATFYNILFTYK